MRLIYAFLFFLSITPVMSYAKKQIDYCKIYMADLKQILEKDLFEKYQKMSDAIIEIMIKEIRTHKSIIYKNSSWTDLYKINEFLIRVGSGPIFNNLGTRVLGSFRKGEFSYIEIFNLIKSRVKDSPLHQSNLSSGLQTVNYLSHIYQDEVMTKERPQAYKNTNQLIDIISKADADIKSDELRSSLKDKLNMYYEMNCDKKDLPYLSSDSLYACSAETGVEDSKNIFSFINQTLPLIQKLKKTPQKLSQADQLVLAADKIIATQHQNCLAALYVFNEKSALENTSKWDYINSRRIGNEKFCRKIDKNLLKYGQSGTQLQRLEGKKAIYKSDPSQLIEDQKKIFHSHPAFMGSSYNKVYMPPGPIYFGDGELDFNHMTDCSSFISSILSVSGYKWYPDQEEVYERLRTDQIQKKVSRNNDCFKKVDFKTNSIKEGDILNYSNGGNGLQNGHVVMITKVGSDPLGIEVIRNSPDLDCSDLDASYFNFEFIHSAPASSTEISIQKENRRYRKHLSGNSGIVKGNHLALPVIMRNHLVEIAKDQCRGRYKDRSRWAARYDSIGRPFNVIRATENPKCKSNKLPVVKNYNCIKDCFE